MMIEFAHGSKTSKSSNVRSICREELSRMAATRAPETDSFVGNRAATAAPSAVNKLRDRSSWIDVGGFRSKY